MVFGFTATGVEWVFIVLGVAAVLFAVWGISLQISSGRGTKSGTDHLESIDRKTPEPEDPRAQPPPTPLVSIRIPKNPTLKKPGVRRTIYFPSVLITNLTQDVRFLQFSLSMTDCSFADVSTFQELYKGSVEMQRNYFSNPLHLGIENHQKQLAFFTAGGGGFPGVADTWDLTIYDRGADKTYTVSGLGEFRLYSDGSAVKK